MATKTIDDLYDLLNGFVKYATGSRGTASYGGGGFRKGGAFDDDDERTLDDRIADIQKEYETRKKYRDADQAERKKMAEEERDEIDKKLEKEKEYYESLKDEYDRIKEKIKNGEKLTEKEEETLKKQKEHLKKILEYTKDRAEAEEEVEKNTVKLEDRFRKIASGVKQIVKSIQKFNDAWAKADQAAANYTKTLGGTAAAMDRLRRNTIDNVVNKSIGINYNMSIDELLKAQEAYARAVGRNLRIDNTQQENLAALTKVMGPEATTQMAAAFENFGLSLNGTAQHAGKMFKEASEYGISFDKYSQNVRENISMAQNYTFKNGLAGLESMARKATAIKLDMKQIESFSNKVNTIEGALGTAAKLQVLGGPFASMSDPMGMLNEALTDTEGLMNRFQKMFGNFAQFNKKTGEVEVSAFNRQRIRQATEALGMDYNQVMTSIYAEGKRKEVEKQLRATGNPNGLSDKMMELVKNSATFNENGQAGVSINGEFKTLNQLHESDYGLLVEETQSEAEDIKDIARMMRGLVEKREGFQKQWEATQAQQSERSGLGKAESMILDELGHANSLLQTLVWVQLGASIFNGISNIFSGFGRNLGGRMWRGIEKVGRSIGRGIGKVGKGIGNVGRSIGKGFSKIAGKATTGATGRIVGGVAAGGATMAATTGLMTSAAPEAAMLGTDAAVTGGGAAVEGATGLGVKGVTNLGTKVGSRIWGRGVERGFTRMAIKYGGKKFAQKAAVRIGAKFLGKAVKGMSNPLGLVGAAGDIATDYLVATNKIRTGSFAHYAGKMASGALEWGTIGAALGGGWGAAIGATAGAVKGFFEANAARRKKKFGDRVNKILSERGVALEGDYRGGQLKKIEKALKGEGELSESLRRKMIKEGDQAVLEEIDKAKGQKETGGEGGEGVEKNIAEGYFTVENAYFGEGEGGFSRGNVSREREKSAGQDVQDSMSWGLLSPLAFLIKRSRHTENRAPVGISGIMGGLLSGDNAFSGRRRRSAFGEEDAYTYGGGANIPSSISVNVNGSIKLTDAQGKSFDIAGQLLKDTVFIRDLANLISKQMNISEKGANFVDSTAQKA